MNSIATPKLFNCIEEIDLDDPDALDRLMDSGRHKLFQGVPWNPCEKQINRLEAEVSTLHARVVELEQENARLRLK